jgi:hypothetical protein
MTAPVQSHQDTGAAVGRLALVHALLRQAGATFTPGALPSWIEPPRHRPLGGFGIGAQAHMVLARVYPGQDSVQQQRTYDVMRKNSLASAAAREQAYGADLRKMLESLQPQLLVAARDSLRTHLQTVQALSARHDQAGIDEALHQACRRIIQRLPGPARPGGVPEDASNTDGDGGRAAPAASASNASEQAAAQPMARPDAADGGAQGPGDTPSGGVPDSKAGAPLEVLPAQTALINRHAMIRAVAEERRRIEAGDALNPADQGEAVQTRDVVQLLGVMSLLPDVVQLVNVYSRSPLAGSDLLREKLGRAARGLTGLLQRWGTGGADNDDLWRYSPFVVVAVQRLGWHSIPGAADSAVALGRVLAMTRTRALVDAAGMLLAAVSLGVGGAIGAAGAVVIALLDVGLSGAAVGLQLLRAQEAALAGDASLLLTREHSLAQEPEDEIGPLLDIAAAIVAVAGLASSLRELKAVLARPAAINPTPPTSGLELNREGADLAAIDAQAERFAYKAGAQRPQRMRGNAPLKESVSPSTTLTLEEMESGGTAVTRERITGTFGPAIEEATTTPQQMAARARRAAAEPAVGAAADDLGSAAQSERYRLTDQERGTAQRIVSDDITSTASRESVPFQVDRSFNEFDPAELASDAQRYAVTAELPRAQPGKGPVITTEQRMFDMLWSRKDYSWPEDIKAWAARTLRPGDVDPLVRWVRVEAVQIDHIVAIERVKQFWGYSRLTPRNQQIVYEYRRNLMPVSASVNQSRGSKTFMEWTQYKSTPLDPAMRARMINLENELEQELQLLIEGLLAEQNAARGTTSVMRPRLTTGEAPLPLAPITTEVSRQLAGERERQRGR